MIIGLDKFKAHFKDYSAAFVLIGGVACDEWFTSQGLPFRATKDIDVVLIVEVLDQAFVTRFWEFIEAGQYEIREKDGKRELYRFKKPKSSDYPQMIEIFSRKPGTVDLNAGQRIVPISVEDASGSLSAILLDDDYYNLITTQIDKEGDLPRVKPDALIPLKACAWLDLTRREKEGNKNVDKKDIAKHRGDVFRIAATLPEQPGPDLAAKILEHLKAFLAAFPPESEEWEGILASLRTTFGSTKLTPEELVRAIQTYFKIA